MKVQNYELFLKNLNLIQKKYEILHSYEDDFNIFSILRDEGDEVNLHSKFITELLRSKKYGKVFFERFLEINDLNKDEITEYKVTQEYYAGDMGRIDIVIELKTTSGRRVIAIENKIYAGDQNKQLERYFKFMKSRGYSSEKIDIIYLTINGESPSKESLGCLKEEDIVNTSYKTEIISWVELCIKEAALSPMIRETLIQYKKLLEKLTNKGEKNMINELKELILSDEKYLSTAFLIPDVVTEIKTDLQYKFWKSLEKGMKELASNFNLVLDSATDAYDRARVAKYYINNRKYHGIVYEMKEFENKEKLYLKIEVNDSSIYWGLMMFDKDDKNITSKKIEEKKVLKNIGFSSDSWWMGYKYLYLSENSFEAINFRNFNENLRNTLTNDEKLNHLADRIINEIRNDLILLKEQNIF